MHGIQKVLVFCVLVAVLPIIFILIPLYLRHISYADVAYAVTESDIMEINDGISTIFCSAHSLKMNSTFNAFQMVHRPEITSKRKHIRLKKSMSLPDDTLEYWGFYLLKGATVSLSVCSRFPGASILVVKGERNLHTCGLLDHTINKQQTEDLYLPGANKQVKIIYESNAQEIDSKESNVVDPINIYNTTNVHTPIVHVNSENSVNRNEKVLINTNNNTNNITYNTNNNTYNNTHNNVHNNTQSYNINESLVKDLEMWYDTAQSYNINESLVKDLEMWYDTAATYIQKHIDQEQEDNVDRIRKLRHLKRKNWKDNMKKKNMFEKVKQRKRYMQDQDRELRIQKLQRELYSEKITERDTIELEIKLKDKMSNKRFKRNQEFIKPSSLLDQGIRHGGNADKNSRSNSNEASSISSFENGLFECYGGAILLAHEFEPSNQCTNIFYLLNGKHAQANHNVAEDGYYYYIFYSDNDIVSNDIYAVFDIYKPTFQYENVTKSCINMTECSFSLNLLSADRIIVEIPTKDGIEYNEMDDKNILISTCQPRMGAYMIFPIVTLLFILGCAFM